MNEFKEPSEQQLRNLFDCYQKGNYSEAEVLATKISEEFPSNQLSWKILSSIFKQSGRLSKSLAAGKKAVELNIQDPDAHNNLGNTLRDMGRFKDSEVYFRKAIEIKPDFLDSHNGLGIALYKTKKFKEAELSFKKALELNPNLTGCNNNLGATLQELGKFKEAQKYLEKELSINPGYIESYYNLGLIMHKLSRPEEAEIFYTKSTKLNPRYFQAYYNLGNLFQELDRPDEAEVNYKMALSIKPDYAEAYYNLGNLFQELDRPDEAEVNYKKTIELQSNFSKAFNSLGVMLQKLGRIKEAEECYKKYIGIEPDGTSEIISVGSTLFENGEYKKAISYFDDYNTQESRANSLYSLYALGRIDDIYNRIKLKAKLDDKNLMVAAFSSFISSKQKKDVENNFCKNPLDFIYYSSIENHIEHPRKFITNIVSTLPKIKSLWNPANTSVRNGFQTNGDIFKTTHKSIFDLKLIILSEIDSYHMKFKNESCTFIDNWPIEKNLQGWHIILKEQGFNTPHIHPSGWLSGVIYLEVVPSLEKNEGAIEFSLNGEHYFHNESPKITYQPKIGDIIFFPSSLNHKTIPFSTNKDRVIISFDLLPDKSNN